MDEIRVPTGEYMNLLEERGFERNKMTLFKRGIDTGVFAPKNGLLKEKMGIKSGINLLYAGRISKDKNLDFLSLVYDNLLKKINKLNLIIVGDGPYLPEMKTRYKKNERVFFTGALDNKDLPEIYSFSDILVFPSTTDTFGMVVLEAQSCGLPAIVSDTGGPKEIIKNGITGWALSINHEEWEEKIQSLIDMILNNHQEYLKMRNETRKMITDKFGWGEVLSELFEDKAFKNDVLVKKPEISEIQINNDESSELLLKKGKGLNSILKKMELLGV